MKRRHDSDAAVADRRRGRFIGPLLAANVLVIGITVTLLVVGSLRSAQRANADRVMDQRTAVARAAVIAETSRYQALLRAVATGAGTNVRFDARDFAAVTGALDTAGLLGATSVAFVAAGKPGGEAALQAQWRGRGAAGLTLKPVANVPEHYYSIFQRTLRGPEISSTGIDVAGSREATSALVEARRTGRPTVSDTYILLRDRGLPARQQQLSFVFAAPMYAVQAEDRARTTAAVRFAVSRW
ncbi:CHASE domain-containing protein [Actinoplanes sp. NPDC051633]|uniref:CHASE domain-containing protein n=1 Tax=Actinoplanes sp. NPDC051633 TaxID=3155670 RepID=UPI003427374C